MTDQEQCKLLERFINNNPLAVSIRVTVGCQHKSFKPRYDGMDAHYDEANMLSSILTGAENFCYWLRRNNYRIVGGKSNARTNKK